MAASSSRMIALVRVGTVALIGGVHQPAEGFSLSLKPSFPPREVCQIPKENEIFGSPHNWTVFQDVVWSSAGNGLLYKFAFGNGPCLGKIAFLRYVAVYERGAGSPPEFQSSRVDSGILTHYEPDRWNGPNGDGKYFKVGDLERTSQRAYYYTFDGTKDFPTRTIWASQRGIFANGVNKVEKYTFKVEHREKQRWIL